MPISVTQRDLARAPGDVQSVGNFVNTEEFQPDSGLGKPWDTVARLYSRWLNSAAGKTFGVGLGRGESVDDALRRARAALQPGDLLVVDVPGRVSRDDVDAVDRDSLTTALFRAGFDCPMTWAGRKVLQVETSRSFLFNRLMPSSALGAGPSRIPGIDGEVVPPTDRIVAIARRSELAPPSERRLRLSVVMPVYNERATFRDVIDHLLAKSVDGFDIEICVVESNSTDGTRDEVLAYAEHPRVRVLLEDKPSGKGHAVREGLKIATGDILLIQDADLEYDLDDYEKLLEPIRSYEASFVLGSRHPAGESAWQIRHFEGQRDLANVLNVGHIFFTWFLNVAFQQKLRDPFTMYKVFRRDCIHNMLFECNRFDFDHELVGKLVRNGFSPIEINVHYKSRPFHEGKKVSIFRDPPTWIKACVRHRFSKLHVWPEQV